MPQISVIVPVYKIEKYIRRCVDSILAQTFEDFDLILVDDGSPDHCGAICDEYAKQDSRIHVIHQENSGLSAARNAGIDWSFANSSSQWLAFVDSDDWVHPKFLEALWKAVHDTGTMLSVCIFQRTSGEAPMVDESALKPLLYSPETLYCGNTAFAIPAWNKLYNKSCWSEIRFPVGKIHEDEFTTYRIIFEQNIVAVIDQPLYAYFQNPEGIMNSLKLDPIRINTVFEACEFQYSFFKSMGFAAALTRCEERKLSFMAELLIKHQLPKNQEKAIRKNLRKDLRLWKMPFADNKYFYEAAYPRLMDIYWKCHSLLRKVSKVRNFLQQAE